MTVEPPTVPWKGRLLRCATLFVLVAAIWLLVDLFIPVQPNFYLLGSLCSLSFLLPIAFAVYCYPCARGAKSIGSAIGVASVFLITCAIGLVYVWEMGGNGLPWGVPGTTSLKLTFNGKRADLERLVSMMRENPNLNAVSSNSEPVYADSGAPAANPNGKPKKPAPRISDSRLNEYRDLLRRTGAKEAEVYDQGCYLFSGGLQMVGLGDGEQGGYAYLDRPPAKISDWISGDDDWTEISYRPLSGHWYLFWLLDPW